MSTIRGASERTHQLHACVARCTVGMMRRSSRLCVRARASAATASSSPSRAPSTRRATTRSSRRLPLRATTRRRRSALRTTCAASTSRASRTSSFRCSCTCRVYKLYSYSCRETHPALANELEEFKQHMKESVKQMPVLKVWQLQGK